MSQLLVKRLSVSGPTVLPKFFAMVGDYDDQGVFQNPELLQLAKQLLQAPVVVEDLAVVTIDGVLDESLGIDSALKAKGAADSETAMTQGHLFQFLEIAVEIRRFGGIGEFLFESGGGPVRRVRVR